MVSFSKSRLPQKASRSNGSKSSVRAQETEIREKKRKRKEHTLCDERWTSRCAGLFAGETGRGRGDTVPVVLLLHALPRLVYVLYQFLVLRVRYPGFLGTTARLLVAMHVKDRLRRAGGMATSIQTPTREGNGKSNP